jgi:hypothetical protein
VFWYFAVVALSFLQLFQCRLAIDATNSIVQTVQKTEGLYLRRDHIVKPRTRLPVALIDPTQGNPLDR